MRIVQTPAKLKQNTWRHEINPSVDSDKEWFHFLWTGQTNVIQGCRVRARRGPGDFHLKGRDECVMGRAGSSLGLPPVLTQAATQEKVFAWGLVFALKMHQRILCRDTTKADYCTHHNNPKRLFFPLNPNSTLLLTSINTEPSAAYRQDFGSRLSTKICEKC